MKNSEKILKSISNLIENGILTSKDIRNGISTDLKFTKDKIVNKLELVSREEFEVLKKIDAEHIILIDDVFTSGATLREMAKVIKQHNRDIRLDAWVFAKA